MYRGGVGFTQTLQLGCDTLNLQVAGVVLRVISVETMKHLLVSHNLLHSLEIGMPISPASRMSLTASTVTKWATVAVMSAACSAL